jgi:hypothetical protein
MLVQATRQAEPSARVGEHEARTLRQVGEATILSIARPQVPSSSRDLRAAVHPDRLAGPEQEWRTRKMARVAVHFPRHEVHTEGHRVMAGSDPIGVDDRLRWLIRHAVGPGPTSAR